MDPDFLLHALSGGALITAAVAVARLLLDYVVRPEHSLDRQERQRLDRGRDHAREEHEREDRERQERERQERERLDRQQQERERQERERRLRHQRGAEARLERILQDRLTEADLRLERADADFRAERARVATLEQDLLRLQQAYDALRLEHASLLQVAEAQRPSA